ncbi:2'-5' RNA ligase family protein [Amycolatopsis sp. K13G38]|uniref:2'-5' RNA ligase family protein n=1 Tax=Amycolatopsis acididurans TaxID=2724524 RepID=A0ABX1J0E5_9PSEU|nr:2'-5' RNA ligase family protein [Amycolatopsis acididurans]NKQ51845.1 2'-5' RNA ligase family protein [Amycolatopsis acididurans]
MTADGRSVLAIPVPAADPLLARAAQRSSAARRGLPAHISLLYPFLPAGELGEPALAKIADLLAPRAAVEVRFERCHHRDGFVFLRPEPAGPLTDLIAALRHEWPGVSPYGGRFGDTVEPHLTVAMDAGPDDATELARSVEDALPLTTHLTEAWLATFTTRWRLVRRFPFSAGRS